MLFAAVALAAEVKLSSLGGHPGVPIEQVGNGAVSFDAVMVLAGQDWFPSTRFFGTGIRVVRFTCPPYRRRSDRRIVFRAPSASQAAQGLGLFDVEFPCGATPEDVRAAIPNLQHMLNVTRNPRTAQCSRDPAACDSWRGYLELLLTGELESAMGVEYCGLRIELGLRGRSPPAVRTAPAALTIDQLIALWGPDPMEPSVTPEEFFDRSREYLAAQGRNSGVVAAYLEGRGIEIGPGLNGSVRKGGAEVPTDVIWANIAANCGVDPPESCAAEALTGTGVTYRDLQAIAMAQVQRQREDQANMRREAGVTDPYVSVQRGDDGTIRTSPVAPCRWYDDVQAVMCPPPGR